METFSTLPPGPVSAETMRSMGATPESCLGAFDQIVREDAGHPEAADRCRILYCMAVIMQGGPEAEGTKVEVLPDGVLAELSEDAHTGMVMRANRLAQSAAFNVLGHYH